MTPVSKAAADHDRAAGILGTVKWLAPLKEHRPQVFVRLVSRDDSECDEIEITDADSLKLALTAAEAQASRDLHEAKIRLAVHAGIGPDITKAVEDSKQ